VQHSAEVQASYDSMYRAMVALHYLANTHDTHDLLVGYHGNSIASELNKLDKNIQNGIFSSIFQR
jgi:hypothetical protein